MQEASGLLLSICRPWGVQKLPCISSTISQIQCVSTLWQLPLYDGRCPFVVYYLFVFTWHQSEEDVGAWRDPYETKIQWILSPWSGKWFKNNSGSHKKKKKKKTLRGHGALMWVCRFYTNLWSPCSCSAKRRTNQILRYSWIFWSECFTQLSLNVYGAVGAGVDSECVIFADADFNVPGEVRTS